MSAFEKTKAEEFIYIDVDYAAQKLKKFEPRYETPTYSANFEAMLDLFTEIRRELGYERITPAQAFERALVVEKEAGFHGLKFSADGVDASGYIKAIKDEIRDLGFKPDYTGCMGGGDNSQARSGFYDAIEKDMVPLQTILTLKPLKPVRLDFETVVSEAVTSMTDALSRNASGSKTIFAAAVAEGGVREIVEAAILQAMPVLAENHILVEGVPQRTL